MKELVVISGKGGTGKTSITASLALLASRPVLADCDVDASDLHLILAPIVRERHVFTSGHQAVIRPNDCIGCGSCQYYCRFDAISMVQTTDELGSYVYKVDPVACEGCRVCVDVCPVNAIDFPESDCGEWMISDARSGTMVHARLGIGAENSGKLVSVVRENARRLAEKEQAGLIIVDGPPGIGCPVISSLTGATHVLVVTEPTVSGEHDLERVLALTRHFNISTSVCINKWDINPEMAARIEQAVVDSGALFAGRISYDTAFTRAQVNGLAVVEMDCPVADDVRKIWDHMGNILSTPKTR